MNKSNRSWGLKHTARWKGLQGERRSFWSQTFAFMSIVVQALFSKAANAFGLAIVLWLCSCAALHAFNVDAAVNMMSGARGRRRGTIPGLALVAASYARFSSELQDDSSIDQQQRKCREKATQNGHTIREDLEFFDHAVSGTKRDREGLNAMLAAAREGRFGVVYFQCLSRLARAFVITLQMLKELVYVCRVRIISVSEGIDSANGNWELLAIFRSWMHEEYLKVLREAVLRGQEEAVLNDYSVGDWCLGYGSEPIPGSEVGRRGRNRKPRMRYVVNEEHAKWVRRVFRWFVNKRRSLGGIARKLSKRKAPKDHRSKKKEKGWDHDAVKRLLRRCKYIGIWPWGQKTNVRNPLTGDLWQEDRPPEEAKKWERERPHLRIIDDETFFKAQALLDELAEKYDAVRGEENGQFRGSTRDTANPRHLLQQLVKCGHCEDGTFQVSGANGKYLGCSNYKRGTCKCKTRLRRDLAKRMILDLIGQRILAQPAWHDAVRQELETSWERIEATRPSELQEIERAMQANEQKRKHLVDQMEDGSADPDVQQRLAERRSEWDALVRRHELLKRAHADKPPPPTAEWVVQKMGDLRSTLTRGGPAAAVALRELVGGRITVSEVQPTGRKRKFLRGKFTVTVANVIASIGGNTEASVAPEQTTVSEEIVLDFVEPPPWAAIADQVKALFDAGVEYTKIASELHCKRSRVTKALTYWHEQRGLPPPDGRQHRKRLDRETLPQKLADQVKELMDRGLLLQEIAILLDCDRNIVTAAKEDWYTSRGLAVPDGRTRRKALPRKSSSNGPEAEPPPECSPE